MQLTRTIGFVFVEQAADWEYALLAAAAVGWLGARAVILTPDGEPVRSQGGVLLAPERNAEPSANVDLNAVAVIGSDLWASPQAPDVGPLLTAVAGRGGIVGGICAGTLALARAGLLDGVRHTSNGRDWILTHEPDYIGQEHYQDVPHAVADGLIVTAPGTAPGTFAHLFLSALYPDRASEVAEMKAMFAKEYVTSLDGTPDSMLSGAA
ncbi:DJ-1/PfpI family protein [Pseudaminobacter sp. 19-2017]|uniref:DJ-1/PfpI family protein n=1 Tax=Pseudaminobacter soli (ex Zhang et al. 2022) TaxID=2831468 RepID=A0A942E2K3_9HYPH|nr:DJ-1/PfpI family protein [Pseudaminobacter soli]MBS3649870.1 DJ-1/PfpI family protein [Pseudaminobacter soli]